MLEHFTREELFSLVWEQPVRELSEELGVSDAAINRRCKLLQVPTPPRGYWARLRSGKRVQKPALRAYSELVAERLKRRRKNEERRDGNVQLSPLQLEIFEKAIAFSSAGASDADAVRVLKTGTRIIDDELAAQLVLIVQSHYLDWLAERAAGHPINPSAMQSVRNLIAKLLQVAEPHVLVLSTEGKRFSERSYGPTVVIRMRAEFHQVIANLHAIVVNNGLNYLAYDLYDLKHTWIVQYIYHYEQFTGARSQLCISADELWVECKARQRDWFEDDLEVRTARIPISSVTPVELTTPEPVTLPTCLDITRLHVSRERIEAFLEAERAHEIISTAVYRNDFQATPPETLVMFEKLTLPAGARGSLGHARETARRIEDDIERWEMVLDAEREDFCKDALGISKGTTVLSEVHGKPVRLRAESFDAYVSSDGEISLSVNGIRYRKDGSVGKREDRLYWRLDPKPQPG